MHANWISDGSRDRETTTDTQEHLILLTPILLKILRDMISIPSVYQHRTQEQSTDVRSSGRWVEAVIQGSFVRGKKGLAPF